MKGNIISGNGRGRVLEQIEIVSTDYVKKKSTLTILTLKILEEY